MIKKDVLVVGSGPAGATAAKETSKKGLDTLLVEKRQEIGSPIRCAEGVGKSIENHVDLKKELISKDVVGAKVFSPSKEWFEMTEEVAGNEVGYILDRRKFDRFLVEKAIEEGSEVKLRTRAESFKRENQKIRTKVIRNGKELEIKTDVLIAADGVESRLAQLADVTDSLNLNNLVSCAQYLVTGLNHIDLDFTHFHLGKDFAPGGYAWIFPKGKDKANIGLGIQPTMAEKRPIDYLDDFLDRINVKKDKVIEEIFGAVPVAPPLDEAIDDNFLIIGDAARQSDPITGGGIINAIKAGEYAAEAIKEAKEKGEFKKQNLMTYENKRKENIAKKNERNFKLKELFQSLNDKQYDSIIGSLVGSDFDKLSVESIVEKLLTENPAVAKKINKVI